MKTLIANDSTEGHVISKYSFKVLALGATPSSENSSSVLVSGSEEPQESTLVSEENESEEDSITSTGSRDELVESLLKKTDDISSNFIKMQMKLEAAEEEHKVALEAAKKEAYETGIEEGRSQILAEQAQKSADGVSQFATSVQTLEASAAQFETALEGIQGELLHAALDIAKEVVLKEMSTNSSDIAKTLSDGLIEQLQGASKVTLKVNPKDHGALSEKLGSLKHIELVSDSAISPGGVIAISDAGNIDAEIMKRFAGVKKAALSAE